MVDRDVADHEAGLCDAVETTHWVRDAAKVVDYWRQAICGPADDEKRYDERAFHGSFTLDGMFRQALGKTAWELTLNHLSHYNYHDDWDIPVAPEAYRRDRSKDVLLQENGYLVLRFLAEDIGKHLDMVLDGIHRALAHRERQSSS